MPGDEGPEDPVDRQSGYESHDDREASGPGDCDDGGGAVSRVGA